MVNQGSLARPATFSAQKEGARDERTYLPKDFQKGDIFLSPGETGNSCLLLRLLRKQLISNRFISISLSRTNNQLQALVSSRQFPSQEDFMNTGELPSCFSHCCHPQLQSRRLCHAQEGKNRKLAVKHLQKLRSLGSQVLASSHHSKLRPAGSRTSERPGSHCQPHITASVLIPEVVPKGAAQASQLELPAIVGHIHQHD